MPLMVLVSMAPMTSSLAPARPVARLVARIPAGFHARRGTPGCSAPRDYFAMQLHNEEVLLTYAILCNHTAEPELSLRRHPECIPNVTEVLNVSAGSLHEIGVSGTRGVLEALFRYERSWISYPSSPTRA